MDVPKDGGSPMTVRCTTRCRRAGAVSPQQRREQVGHREGGDEINEAREKFIPETGFRGSCSLTYGTTPRVPRPRCAASDTATA